MTASDGDERSPTSAKSRGSVNSGESPRATGKKPTAVLLKRARTLKLAATELPVATMDVVFDAIKKAVYIFLEGEPPEEDGEINPEEMSALWASKALPSLNQVWRAICTHLLQEFTVGRAVSMPNIGTFWKLEPSDPPEAVLRISEKLLQDVKLGLRDAPPVLNGPASKMKLERIVDLLPAPLKSKAEDLLNMITKEMKVKLVVHSEVSFEFPGIGALCMNGGLVSWSSNLMLRTPRQPLEVAPKAGHSMFGAAGVAFRKRSQMLQEESNAYPPKGLVSSAFTKSAATLANRPRRRF